MRKLILPWVLALMVLLAIPVSAEIDKSMCWIDSKTRGAGTIPKGCPAGQTFRDGLCYTNCAPGYAEFVTMCIQKDCPAGFRDDGLFCAKPASYGRGFGQSEGACNRDHNYNCQQWGLLWYPRCKPGYKAVGCCMCEPECPNGMSEFGVSCTKNTYDRGVGKIPNCGSGMEKDAGLCYPTCGTGYNGIGPVCWGTCPADYPKPCGAACAKSPAACIAGLTNQLVSTASVVVNVATFMFPGAAATLKQALGVTMEESTQAILGTATATSARAIMSVAHSYAVDAGKALLKKYVVSIAKKPVLAAYQELGDRGLEGLNKAASEFSVLKEAKNVDVNWLAGLDPTGVSAMVTAFAKYEKCAPANQFSLSRGSLDLGNIGAATRTLDVQLTANRTTRITRLATPAFQNATIVPTTDCIGRTLSPGQTCRVSVVVTTDNVRLDTELRIYSDLYNTVAYPVGVTANPGTATEAVVIPQTPEAMNLTLVQGTWAMNYDQSQKVNIDASGIATRLNTGERLTIEPTPRGALGRTFDITKGGTTGAYTLDDSGDRLSFLPNPVPMTTIKLENGKVLKVNDRYFDEGELLSQGTFEAGQYNRLFQFEHVSDGTWRFRALISGMVLTLDEFDRGGKLHQKPWSDFNMNQRFRIEPVGDGRVSKIVHIVSGKVLTVDNPDPESPAWIGLAPWKDLSTQRFQIPGIQTWVRRPTDEGCLPGETKVAGKCYDIPPGFTVTTPGYIGKFCPIDWREDDNTCYAPWTGATIGGQADANTNDFALRHPGEISSCTAYSAANGQNCPANWWRSGPCECKPNTIGREVRPLAGR